jgi:tetratricopeptide (TPR) repeat protein
MSTRGFPGFTCSPLGGGGCRILAREAAVAEKSRLEMLQEFVARKPNDAFTRYGLAMEWKSLGKNDEAVREFQTLFEKNPDYVPSYLMCGQILSSLGRTDEAKKVLERGVATAQKVGNMHALGEISELLSSLS